MSNNFKLSTENKTIFKNLPKEYRDIIFNNILSKGLTEIKLKKELSLYIEQEKQEDIFLNIKKNKVKKKDRQYIKTNEKTIDNQKLFTF